MKSICQKLLMLGFIASCVSLSSLVKISSTSAQNTQAVIFDPPSNVRMTPNGEIICSIKAVTAINTYDYYQGWYVTDVCGGEGYIHESQIRWQDVSATNNSATQCLVTNIQRGQLAVRSSPGGEAIAGLNNDNLVEYIQSQGIWYYIQVIAGPNRAVDGKRGWVNSDYLNCF